ncbi:putative E3 ubiquitin-protein ligase UNKL isoform X1 [Rhopilema esculentum]|uniref:putative E3 ubiquitin-protein ligase UNKL isoform X1 n=1 Tax=Rhopilema esculentum TaxID=499914 RepID=UPI0031DE82DE
MAESYQNTTFASDELQNPGLLVRKNTGDPSQPQTEKPFHYTYLKEFRVEQCQLFLQHKCSQHRPFTCFYWHFLNQRRRRPKKKKDGTFNYSPDEYCSQYNETTGECPQRDECPYLHRVAGDVERRYHLRYYKTSPCVHETDPRGLCVKNGAHCAFAHGPADLRQPVYDIRELQAMEQEEKGENRQIIPEDPRWNDTKFVLATYKTEPCKKPPRLCRQGYACPQYHNNRDRRRSPVKYKYRSTPCPNVKHGDEWGDPNACENGDSCPYCHTRTEQQFHPEIYKSTKCNDMQQTGNCPRGPFCAFAHPEQDSMIALNTVTKGGGISIIPDKEILQRGISQSSHSSLGESPQPSPASQQPIARPHRSMSTSACMAYSSVAEHGMNMNSPLSTSAPSYEKAPGSGRRSGSITSRDGDMMPSHHIGSECRTLNKQSSSSSFYASSNTVESVVENALDDLHLGLDDIDIGDIDRDLNDNASIGSSIGSGPLGSAPLHVFQNVGSDPVTIPGSEMIRNQSITSQTSTSPTSPLGQLGFFAPAQNHIGFVRSPSGKNNQHSSSFFDGMNVQSPKQQLTSPLGLSAVTDAQRLSEEVVALRSKLSSYEESWNQAKHACEAWKREASEQCEKSKSLDRERMMLQIKLSEAETELKNLRDEIEARHGGPHIYSLKNVNELDSLSILELKQIHKQLKVDISRLEKVISKKETLLCTVCENSERSCLTFPCSHCVMCEHCAAKKEECPFCHTAIQQKNAIFIPL